MNSLIILLLAISLCGCQTADYSETQANITVTETTEQETHIERRKITKEPKNDEVEIENDYFMEWEVYEPTTAETETETETEAESETETEPATEEVVQDTAPHYSIGGHVMPIEWQDFLYAELKKYGTEELYPYLQAQALQESRFNEYDVTDGLDYGLFQYRLQWWDDHCEQAGIYYEADIYNPYTQIYVRAFLASKAYIETGSLEYVIKRHMNGTPEQNEDYWKNQVSPWFSQIERID